MAITNPVLFGLKVAFNFSDIQSRNTALNNLGLDIRDLEVIQGIGGNLDRIDLQQVSGLDVNLTRYIDRLKADVGQYSNLIGLSSGYAQPMRGNLEAYGAVSGGAVRFKFVPNDKGTNVAKTDLKYGDISTSRVSAWSGGSEANPTEAISYGASVQLKGALRLGTSSTYTVGSNETILKVLDTPEPVRFDTEVPTETIKINLNGQDAYVYAMRGIPQIFTMAFKSLQMDFYHNAYNVDGVNKTPIYTFTDTDTGAEIVSRPSIIGSNLSRIRFNSSTFKERQLRVYFPPKNITTLVANNANLAVFPNVKYPNVTQFQLINNILTEMPNWCDITYTPSYNNDKTAITDFNSTLRTVNVQNNLIYQNSVEDERFFGSYAMTKFPTSLYNLNIRGCYTQHSTFLNADEYLVLKVTLNEYNAVLLDTEEKQTFTFDIGSPAVSVDIKGIYFDKETYTKNNTTVRYIYIKEPQRVGAGSTTPISSIANHQNQVEVLDLYTRCPRLRDLNMQNLGNRRIYRTTASKYVDVYNNDFYNYVVNQEITPRVNLKELRSINIYDCYFTKLNPIWENPSTTGGLGSDPSPLTNFQVGENEALTSTGIDFSLMNSIQSISIYDTSLPIPSGLQNKTGLQSLNCNYTRFPTRGATVNHLAPGGQPIAQNNHLWENTTPSSLSDYALANCSNLRSLNFYASRLDGMIPKFIGNTELRTVDFRYTSIEGGRPGGQGAAFNGGEHGRRYIMWDDTFQDAQKVTQIRIFSNVLGRNIGTWDAATQTYNGAEFQDGTFNLPNLNYLLIDTNGNYLNGAFFATSGAPNLQELHSNGVGWGNAFADGTPFPSFSGNTNLYRVDLRNNKFKGTIQLVNLNRLRFFYASSNIITGIGNLVNLPALNYFYAGSNQIIGAVPDFSAAAPNIQYIGLNSNNINAYNTGSLTTLTRIRSLDLSNNYLNQQNVDLILEDLLANYNLAPRRGVLINLTGPNMGAPTSNTVVTPTTSTSLVAEELIAVNQLDPLNPQLVFPLATADIRNDTLGTAPNETIYNTKLFIDGSEVLLPNAAVQLDYANDEIEFQPGYAPTTGTSLKVEVYRTVNGTITTQTGAAVIKQELNSKGWTVQTN